MVTHSKIMVSIDSGGTFTDCVVRLDGQFQTHFKVPSTRDNPARAMNSIFERMAQSPIDLCRHGTTVGTNGLLERTGGRVLFITNQGLEDVLKLRRQTRPALYALEPQVEPPLIEDELILSVPWRRTVVGNGIGSPPDWEFFLKQHRSKFQRCDAVAVCFLHACSFSTDEIELKTAINTALPQLPVSISSEISALEREYERACSTVLNAYLQPLISTYIADVRSALPPHADFTVMTSAGGLVPCEQVQIAPIQTVLSGPAGGFLGAATAGRRLGFDLMLSLDMGGTSTDVALIADGLDLKTDYTIMEMPIVTPMLPIETVGAGGGSIAFIDPGGILKVGPRSTGSDPGPACYGRQVALDSWLPTVTDAHVVLGHITNLLGGSFKIYPEHARAAVEQLANGLGASVEATARAIISTCTETMARACRRVSLEQGVDTRDVALVAFGGAGGLHACALADVLKCSAVVFPMRAGVLSAEGISLAPKRQVLERTIHLLEADWNVARFTKLMIPHEALNPPQLEWSVLCRLVGQDRALSLTIDHDTSPSILRERFESKFKKRYGFSPRPSHPLELICIRTIITVSPTSVTSEKASVDSCVSVLSGPKAISTYDATLWLPNGWSATTMSTGDVICRRHKPVASIATPSSVPLGLEVHHQKLMSIAEEMGRVLQDTSLSANIRERRDFSCAIFDHLGQMVAHAAHIPVHLGATPLSVKAVIEHCDPKPNVDYILNNPFAGGTHLPDVTVVRPVFLNGSTEASFYVANRAHHSDVGGVTAGSLPIATRDSYSNGLTIHDEGVCIDPGPLDESTAERFIKASRLPSERRADLAAQVAANRAGEARLELWACGANLSTLKEYNTALIDYSARLTAQWWQALPGRSVHAKEYLESDGLSEIPIKLALTLSKHQAGLVFDFSKSDNATASSLNAVAAITRSAVFYVLKLLVPATPANDGVMKNIEIITRPGSVVDARSPSAVSAGNVETSQRLIDTLLSAFDQFLPGQMPAQSCGSMNNVLMGGQDTRRVMAKAFVHYETLGGGAGGGADFKGADAIHVHMTNTLNTPIEVFERRFPVQILNYSLRKRSKDNLSLNRGGLGIERHYYFECATEVTVIAERHILAPRGVGGGLDGRPGYARLKAKNGQITQLKSKFTRLFSAGETLIIGTADGGGWGRKVSED
jgi:5-oxoprolinase (ATP-hydrolysing)